MTDLQPDTGEVLQEEPDYVMQVAGCVTVKGPVRVQELPAKGGGTRTKTVSDTRPEHFLEPDPRRRRAVLMSMDREIYIAFSQAGIQDAIGSSIWPKGVPFEVDASTDVYVLSAETGQSTRVSVTTYLWAQG